MLPIFGFCLRGSIAPVRQALFSRPRAGLQLSGVRCREIRLLLVANHVFQYEGLWCLLQTLPLLFSFSRREEAALDDGSSRSMVLAIGFMCRFHLEFMHFLSTKRCRPEFSGIRRRLRRTQDACAAVWVRHVFPRTRWRLVVVTKLSCAEEHRGDYIHHLRMQC